MDFTVYQSQDHKSKGEELLWTQYSWKGREQSARDDLSLNKYLTVNIKLNIFQRKIDQQVK